MNYKEKYENLIEQLKKAKEEHGGYTFSSVIDKIVPELKESEDEKIRKVQLNYWRSVGDKEWYGVPVQETIAWLEKQGEKPVKQDTETHDLWVYIREWNDKFGRLPKDEDELASCIDYVMKRQKPADKVEPKFKVGDWVRAISSGNIFKILSVNDGLYRVLCYDGVEANYPIEDVDYDLAYWTIQDAKDGDVLATDSGRPFIFKGLLDIYHPEFPVAYCGIAPDNYFDDDSDNNNEWWTDENVYPATKEQRDLLFQKMKEVGYEWDTKKKELKKIEQKTAEWSEEDEYQINTILHGLDLKRELYKKEGNQVEEKRYKIQYDWLKSVKNRVQPHPKQEWSEEEKARIDKIVDVLDWAEEKGRISYSDWRDYVTYVKSLKPQNKQNITWSEEDEDMLEAIECLTKQGRRLEVEHINWLKSLKPNHWKPSEEQLQALKHYVDTTMDGEIELLYNDLLKL